MNFQFAILTPEARVYDEEVESIVVPGTRGSFGILARHAPMVGAIVPGVVKAQQGTRTLFFIVGEGVVEVGTNRVTILTDAMVRVENFADAEAVLEDFLKDQASPARLTLDSPGYPTPHPTA